MDDIVDPFKEYLKETEPDRQYKAYAWSTAVGLQKVDNLTPSQYLIETARKNIEGEINLEEASSLMEQYYREKPLHITANDRTEEADKVSLHIAQLLSEDAFIFSPNEYISIHRRLFQGIYKYAGKIRDYNITKKEWVLDGATVMYGTATELRDTLEYDFSVERNFSYAGLSMDEIIHHLAVFISRLWQIHIFGEGNTRTTAVFFIKYLRALGFSATNDIFAENAWYFRNALVRANYSNLQKGIHATTEYLERFLDNLLLGRKNELHNRDMHVIGLLTEEKYDIVEKEENNLLKGVQGFSVKTTVHVHRLFDAYGFDRVFGRSDVMSVLDLQQTGASKLLSAMLKNGLISPVVGHGKGKYKFLEKT